jgi:glycosyltransferase involved in cell wall biosynthesis
LKEIVITERVGTDIKEEPPRVPLETWLRFRCNVIHEHAADASIRAGYQFRSAGMNVILRVTGYCSRMRLQVGLVVPRFAPFRGGVETYTSQAAAALAQAGAEVTVVTQAPRNADLPTLEVRDGYSVERYPLPFGDSFDVSSPAAARASSRSGRFDVVWAHSYHTPLAWLVAERTGTPLVLTPHYHGGGSTRLREMLHRPYRLAGRRLMAASRRVVVCTDAEAELVLRDFPRQVPADRITVVPPAVADPARGRPPFPSEAPVVLTVARHEPYKRTDLLVRAIAELRRRAVPVRLVVVGGGSGLDGLRELAAQLAAQDVVTFTGPVDDDTLARWWASASLYATASLQESFGIGLAEALAAGLPVVASGIPAHREVIRRAGSSALSELCAVEGRDVDAASRYADAMARLLRSGGSRGERARRCALPGPAKTTERLLETFNSVRAMTRQRQ